MLQSTSSEKPTFVESALGPGLLKLGLVRRFLAWPASRRVVVLVGGLAGLLYLPYLGAVGLWDPWEAHYGEVAREMIHRHNFVFPFWESAPFYSKPPLLMWMDALGMMLVGTDTSVGRHALYTEWAMRLPSTLFMIGALCLLAYALSRTVGRRIAYATAFVLGTMPLYFLITRQVITDTPFIACLIAALSCAIIGLFDEQTQHGAAWWYGFYVFCGLATLAKELLGVAIPGAVLLLYAAFDVMPWESEALAAHWRWLTEPAYRQKVRAGEAPMPTLWGYLYKMHFGTGLLIFAAVALPWLLSMIFFANGRDPEMETFVHRYFIHDQFGRLAAGVHTTEHDTPFTYFLQMGAYAIFPWVALVPGAFFTAAKLKLRRADVRSHVLVIAVLWVLLAFGVVASSATKFPHYILPALPGLAILIAYFLEELWDEGVAAHAVSLLTGFVLFALVAKDITDGPGRDGRNYMGIPTTTGGLKYLADLITYNHDRPYPAELVTHPIFNGMSLRDILAGALGGIAVLLALAALRRARLMLFTSFTVFAAVFALWFSWGHWVDLSHQWTQRDLFWRYYDHRKPDEPIAAYLMDWKGETFYSRNTVKQIKADDKLQQYIALPGRKWLLVEQGVRLEMAERLAQSAGHRVELYDPALNVKFALISID